MGVKYILLKIHGCHGTHGTHANAPSVGGRMMITYLSFSSRETFFTVVIFSFSIKFRPTHNAVLLGVLTKIRYATEMLAVDHEKIFI